MFGAMPATTSMFISSTMSVMFLCSGNQSSILSTPQFASMSCNRIIAAAKMHEWLSYVDLELPVIPEPDDTRHENVGSTQTPTNR